ncbi:hypothetical protein EK904_003365, partial [Melospiza melodia maxima]
VLWKIREDTAVAMLTQMEQGLNSLASSVVSSECVQLYAELQSNMTIPSHAEHIGWPEGNCEEDTAWFLEDLPGQDMN